MNNRDYLLKDIISQLISLSAEWLHDSSLTENQFNKYIKIKVHLQKIYNIILTDLS
jgi:hypothetical protein